MEAPNASTRHKEDFFDTWSEASAYLLGYLEADGYIKYTDHTVRIYFQCSEKDRDFLEQLKEITKFTGTLGTSDNWANGKKYQKVRFTISSRSWKNSKRFQQLRSGHIAHVPLAYIHHYIRGYFDGDGCVFFEKQSRRIKSSFVFSSRELAYKFKHKLLRHRIKTSNIHKKTNSDRCWYFNISYLQTEKLRHFMYYNSSIYMKRKYNIFNSDKNHK